MFWTISASLKPQRELFARNLTRLPVNWTLENCRAVWTGTDFPLYFWNSCKVAAIATACSVFVSMYAACALARIRFAGSYPFGPLPLATQMFPHILLVIPLFLIFQRRGPFNTHAALELAHAAFLLPFTIWMLRGFSEAIPAELEDAAAIDGATMIGTFHRIILPLAGPGLAAVTMYAFIRAWNEFLFALVFVLFMQRFIVRGLLGGAVEG